MWIGYQLDCSNSQGSMGTIANVPAGIVTCEMVLTTMCGGGNVDI